MDHFCFSRAHAHANESPNATDTMIDNPFFHKRLEVAVIVFHCVAGNTPVA